MSVAGYNQVPARRVASSFAAASAPQVCITILYMQAAAPIECACMNQLACERFLRARRQHIDIARVGTGTGYWMSPHNVAFISSEKFFLVSIACPCVASKVFFMAHHPLCRFSGSQCGTVPPPSPLTSTPPLSPALPPWAQGRPPSRHRDENATEEHPRRDDGGRRLANAHQDTARAFEQHGSSRRVLRPTASPAGAFETAAVEEREEGEGERWGTVTYPRADHPRPPPLWPHASSHDDVPPSLTASADGTLAALPPASSHLRLHAFYNASDGFSSLRWMPGPPVTDEGSLDAWPAAIPRHLHFTCRNASSLLRHPAKIVAAWRALNPSFALTVHDTAAQRSFLEAEYGSDHPSGALAAFDRVPNWAGALRSDLWRTAFLFRYGGVYVDDDVEILLPLAQVLTSDVALATH